MVVFLITTVGDHVTGEGDNKQWQFTTGDQWSWPPASKGSITLQWERLLTEGAFREVRKESSGETVATYTCCGETYYDGDVWGELGPRSWEQRDAEYCSNCGRFRSQEAGFRAAGLLVDVVVGGNAGWWWFCNRLCKSRKEVRVATINASLAGCAIDTERQLVKEYKSGSIPCSQWEIQRHDDVLCQRWVKLQRVYREYRATRQYCLNHLEVLEAMAIHHANPWFRRCACSTQCLVDDGEDGDDEGDEDEGDDDEGASEPSDEAKGPELVKQCPSGSTLELNAGDAQSTSTLHSRFSGKGSPQSTRSWSPRSTRSSCCGTKRSKDEVYGGDDDGNQPQGASLNLEYLPLQLRRRRGRDGDGLDGM